MAEAWVEAAAETGLRLNDDFNGARQDGVGLYQVTQRGNLPIVAGGTGLYLRALLEGLFAGPPRSEELRERLRLHAEQRGPAHLHRILQKLDSAAAAKIHPNDASKLVRAIEVCLSAQERRDFARMIDDTVQ